ncbi:hypothetical protein BGX38DRAFT_1206667 [Terfezia claveryi]|nr:hypothetical protein BGX38DRAFT_1206667 [Terfezia claveryi]
MERKTTQDNLYEVEAIIAEKVFNYPKKSAHAGLSIFKVRWKGYSKEHDTWEPEGHLMGCKHLLKEWRAANPLRGPTQHRSGKRKTDAMDIDSGSPGSPSSEKPLKVSRTCTKLEPGTAAYARWRKSHPLQEDFETMYPDRQLFGNKLRKLPGPPVVLYNDVDDDPSPPVSFEFVPRYKIFAPSILEYMRLNDDFWAGCSCTGGICGESCLCMEENGMSYDKNGRLIWVDNDSAINECNGRCGCGIDCPNRVVQRGRKIPLEIFKTEKKGWGLRCPQKIPKGTFIDTYPGELITLAEAYERAEKYSEMDGGSSYLFDLDKFTKVRKGEDDEEFVGSQGGPMVDTLDADDIFVIDGKNYGGVTRFINHSCDPNLLIYAVTRERTDYRVYDLAMFAHVDIPAYEELTFSYVGGDQGEPETGAQRYDCFCGSSHCKGYLW